MTDFIDSNNLINSRPDEVHSENAPLITLEYILVRRLLGKHTPDYEINLHKFIQGRRLREGLYDQRSFRDGTDEDYMSHDQLTTFCCYSKMNNLKIHEEIWGEIKRQKGCYNNLNPDKSMRPDRVFRRLRKYFKFKKEHPRELNPHDDRFFHPRDLIFYGILNNEAWAKASFPIFEKMMEITCKNDELSANGLPHTSGKLLAFTRCVSLMDTHPKFKKLFFKLTDIIRNNKVIGNWERVFEIYYPNSNHPIRELINAQDRNSWLF